MYKSYISTHLYNWVCAGLRNFKVNDTTLEKAVIIDATRLVRYLIDNNVSQTTTTLLKQPDPNIPLKFQKASTLATTGYGLFGDDGHAGSFEADTYIVPQYIELPYGSPTLVTGTAQTIYARPIARVRLVPAEEIMLQIAARYGSHRTQKMLFGHITHLPLVKNSVVAGAEAACLYYSNPSLLKMLYDKFPSFVHVELTGFCRSRVLLAYKLLARPHHIGDNQLMYITKTIAQRDDLDMMMALEELVPDRHIADLAAVSGTGENAPKILTHYINDRFDELLMYAINNPGASLDWLWETNEEKIKERLPSILVMGLGRLKYKLVLWCMQRGRIPTSSDVWALEMSLTEQEVSPEDRAAVAEIRRLYDLVSAEWVPASLVK